MAIDFSRFNFNFFNRLDARARILFLVGAVIAIIVIIYLGTRFILGGDTSGPSRVATAPSGLISVQGGATTPEYQRAIEQANVQREQQAQMRGTSAIPTMINVGNQVGGCVICPDQTSNVKYALDDWVRQGKISPDVASALQALADRNVPVSEYAAELDRLVREGKLTPEQARELLELYKKQHANNLLADSARIMDPLIKSGQLPLDAANALLEAQKNKVSPTQYAAMLQDLVRQGKISPELAQQLLAQYTQQRAKEITAQSIASLRVMARNGEITPDVEKALVDLETKMVPFDTYSAALKKYLDAGKITPAAARKILEEYYAQKQAIGPGTSINDLIRKAEAEAYAEISDLLKTGKITQDVAALLSGMIQRNVSMADFQATINTLVQQKKLTPEIAKLKLADYQKVKGLRDMAQKLAALQGNNASVADYAAALKAAVAAGLITPDEAARLLREYQALMAPTAVAGPVTAVPGGEDFARLQQAVQQGAGAPTGTTDFGAVQVQTTTAAVAPVAPPEDRSAIIDALTAAMTSQAQQLIASWQPPTMVHTSGSGDKGSGRDGKVGPGTAVGGVEQRTTTTTTVSETPSFIKAGTIMFGVLDTAVNSDYPDTPVMVTIVEGKFKGARLLGKLQTAKNVAGQLDRVSLNFTLMDMPDWPKSKTVTAFAIDPDTARTVMASSVDYHYLKRFGAIMATSFLQGYATAITTSSSTTTTGIFGTSTTHPALDPRQKLFVALGQIGQTLGSAIQPWINIPPTVRVDSGVGLGILFMAEVT